MAFPVEPDNELVYVPTAEDETAGNPEAPVDPSQIPDDDPTVSQPDNAGTVATPVEDAGPTVPTDTESVGYSPDNGLPADPAYASVFGVPLESDAPEVDQDTGDVYSATTLSPTDAEYDSAPGVIPPVQPIEDLDFWESQTTEDFETEDYGFVVGDDATQVPVSYEIQGREPEGAWRTLATVSATEVTTEVRGLPAGEGWTFRIRAVFVTGETGEWSAETLINLPTDLLAPPTPTAPSVKAERGVVTVTWDGLGADASEQPADYKHTVVWVSETGDPSTFTPIGLLFGAGDFLWTNAAYDVNYFFALSSLDLAGNSSARGVATPATLKPLVQEPDIQAELDRIDAETGGLITEAGELNDRLTQAETDLATAEGNLNTLQNTTLPALQGELDTNEATVNTLKNTTIPALDTRLGTAEGEIDSTRTELNSRLDQAFVDIGTAQGDASAALVMAGTKNRVFYGTGIPSPTSPNPSAIGDMFRRLDSSNNVISEYQWSGSSWVQQEITSSAISNLDVGKLSVGTASISTAVVDKLWADVIRARKITADQMVIGRGVNLVAWPYNDGTWSNGKDAEYFRNYTWPSNPVIVNNTTPRNPGQSYVQTFLGDVASGATTLAIYASTGAYATPYGAIVEGGQEFFSSAWVSCSSFVNIAIQQYFYRADGVYLYSTTGSYKNVGNAWQKVEVSAKAPGDAAFSRIYIRVQGPVTNGPTLRVENMSMINKADGNLIVTGSITGDHLEVNTVSAAVANVIKLNADAITAGTINTARLNTASIAAATASIQKADVSNLTASSATISQAVIDKLWAEVIHAKKITADMVIIGAGNNIFPDPFGRDIARWAGSASHQPASGRDGGGALMITATSGQYGAYYALSQADSASRFKVFAGRSYLVSCYVRTNVATSGTNVALYMRTYSETNTTFIELLSIPGSGSWNSGVWYKVSSVVKVPEGSIATSGIIGCYTQSGFPSGYQAYFTEMSVTEMASGELIVDGDITTQKLASKAITADKIATNAITADKIDGGAIDGQVITGATVRTSSSSTRMEMNSTGMSAYKAGVGVFRLNGSDGNLRVGASNKWHVGLQTSSDNRGHLVLDDGGTNDGSYARFGGGMDKQSSWYSSTAWEHYSGGWNSFAELVLGTESSSLPRLEMLFTEEVGGTGGFEERVKAMSIDSRSVEFNGNFDFNVRWSVPYQNGAISSTSVLRGYRTLKPGSTTSAIRRLVMGIDETTTESANFHVASGGIVYKVSSLSADKLDQRVVDDSLDDKLLSVDVKTWIDRTAAETITESYTPETFAEHEAQKSEEAPAPETGALPSLRRIPGVVAEEVRDAGLEEFVTRDGDGELTGVRYDRLGVALIPVVRRQRDRIAGLEGKVAGLEAKLEALLARVEILETSNV